MRISLHSLVKIIYKGLQNQGGEIQQHIQNVISNVPYPLHKFRHYYLVLIWDSPHTIPDSRTRKGLLVLVSKTSKGKCQRVPSRYTPLTKSMVHRAGSWVLKLTPVFPCQRIQIPLVYYTSPSKQTQNKHAYPNPTLRLCVVREHVKWIKNKNGGNILSVISCINIHIFLYNIHSALLAGVTKCFTNHADPSR